MIPKARGYLTNLQSFFVRSNHFKRIKKRLIITDNEELFTGLFNNSTIGLYQTTPKGSILSANPAIIKMLNFDSLEDLLKRDLSKGSYVNNSKREEFKKVLERDGEINDFESEWYTKDGDIIYVKEGARAERNSKGRIIRYDGAVENITKRKKAEFELIKAKKKAEENDRLKTAFLQNISHEIRTPMNSIIGFSELINDNDLPLNTVRSYISMISSSSNQLLSIISDIITISLLETNQVKVKSEDVCINAILEELHAVFSLQISNQKLVLKEIKKLPIQQSKTSIDKTKLVQILSNLIDNAIKFTPAGSVHFGCSLKGHELEFFIRDTGIGIKKELIGEIFKRFNKFGFTDNEHPSGTGLGLSISKELVELLGGRVWIESEHLVGSTFYFTIPYHPIVKLSQ